MSHARVEGPAPTTAAPATDFTMHYVQVKDADTRGPVDEKTKLAAMYSFDQHARHDRLLESVTDIVQPAARCGLKTRNGDAYDSYPETSVPHVHGYDLYITYNRLVRIMHTFISTTLLTTRQMFAPCVRLECRFIEKDEPDFVPYLTISLEFHFSACNGTKMDFFRTTGLGKL